MLGSDWKRFEWAELLGMTQNTTADRTILRWVSRHAPYAVDGTHPTQVLGTWPHLETGLHR